MPPNSPRRRVGCQPVQLQQRAPLLPGLLREQHLCVQRAARRRIKVVDRLPVGAAAGGRRGRGAEVCWGAAGRPRAKQARGAGSLPCSNSRPAAPAAPAPPPPPPPLRRQGPAPTPAARRRRSPPTAAPSRGPSSAPPRPPPARAPRRSASGWSTQGACRRRARPRRRGLSTVGRRNRGVGEAGGRGEPGAAGRQLTFQPPPPALAPAPSSEVLLASQLGQGVAGDYAYTTPDYSGCWGAARGGIRAVPVGKACQQLAAGPVRRGLTRPRTTVGARRLLGGRPAVQHCLGACRWRPGGRLRPITACCPAAAVIAPRRGGVLEPATASPRPPPPSPDDDAGIRDYDYVRGPGRGRW
jgi:hypothetical protein